MQIALHLYQWPYVYFSEVIQVPQLLHNLCIHLAVYVHGREGKPTHRNHTKTWSLFIIFHKNHIAIQNSDWGIGDTNINDFGK